MQKAALCRINPPRFFIDSGNASDKHLNVSLVSNPERMCQKVARRENVRQKEGKGTAEEKKLLDVGFDVEKAIFSK